MIYHEKMIVKRISSVGLLVLVLAGVPSPAQGQGWYLAVVLALTPVWFPRAQPAS